MPKLLRNTKNLKENLSFRIIIILISLINNKGIIGITRDTYLSRSES